MIFKVLNKFNKEQTVIIDFNKIDCTKNYKLQIKEILDEYQVDYDFIEELYSDVNEKKLAIWTETGSFFIDILE